MNLIKYNNKKILKIKPNNFIIVKKQIITNLAKQDGKYVKKTKIKRISEIIIRKWIICRRSLIYLWAIKIT